MPRPTRPPNPTDHPPTATNRDSVLSMLHFASQARLQEQHARLKATEAQVMVQRKQFDETKMQLEAILQRQVGARPTNDVESARQSLKLLCSTSYSHGVELGFGRAMKTSHVRTTS